MLPIPRRFRIQYASNLFAYRDVRQAERILAPAAPYLALLGNVFSTHNTAKRYNTREFLSYCVNNWKRTLIVPAATEMGSWSGGNTEPALFTDLLDELTALAADASAEGPGKVELLEMKEVSFRYEGVRVLGLTGWSAWARQARPCPQSGMPDLYTYSPEGSSRLAAATDAHQFSAEEMEWLGTELTAKPCTPTILLSHGLSCSLLLHKNVDAAVASTAQPDLMTFYPYGAMFGGSTPLVRACLGGAHGITGSRIIGGRFHGVNGWKSHPTQEVPNPNYKPDLVYEYAWYDDEDSGRGLVAYEKWMDLLQRRNRHKYAPAICQ